MTNPNCNNAKQTGTADDLHLSIVIPAYNEQGNIGPVVEETRRVLSGHLDIGPYEIIIIDDGSVDETPAEADRLADEYAEVRVIHHPENRGIGGAIKTGYAAARGSCVTATCADGEISMEDVVPLIQQMDHADLVVSRRERETGRHREIFSRGFHWLTGLIVGFNLQGMEGIYVVRRSILQDLTLHSDTSLVNLEVIMHCARRGCRIASGTIRPRPRLSGTSKMATWRTIARVFGEILKLRVHLWRHGRRAAQPKDDHVA